MLFAELQKYIIRKRWQSDEILNVYGMLAGYLQKEQNSAFFCITANSMADLCGEKSVHHKATKTTKLYKQYL